MATYTYSISGDFPNGKVAPDTLTEEIEGSSISSSTLDYINVAVSAPDNCDIVFVGTLSGADQTTLDGIVAAHQGVEPLTLPGGTPGWNLRVEDRNLTTPPGSPVEGEYYIVATGGTGAWAGCDDCIAGWNGTAWQFQRPTPGLASWVFDEDIVVVYVDDTTKWDPYGVAAAPSSVFGTELHLAESTAVSTTTSATIQTKISMTTATLAGGIYRLEVSYGWNSDNAVGDFLAGLVLDGTLLGQLHLEEPSDIGGTFGATGTDQRHYFTRFYHLNLSAQSHTVVLVYLTGLAGTAASMWDAYLSLWRMS